MNKPLLIFLALFLSISATSFGQKKSKEEVELEKEWAKKLKLLKPLDYKKLMDDKESLSNQVSELERSQVDLKSEIEKKDAEISKLKKELEDYNSGMAPVVVKTSQAGNTNNSAHTRTSAAGVVYKVQIGSFRNKDLSKYFDNNPNFSGEVDQDGAKKYTLGVFSDYWEADKFKKALREMGVKDAWIVAYKDGKRVNIKDVLEGTL